jgi:hypothetical protein
VLGRDVEKEGEGRHNIFKQKLFSSGRYIYKLYCTVYNYSYVLSYFRPKKCTAMSMYQLMEA